MLTTDDSSLGYKINNIRAERKRERKCHNCCSLHWRKKFCVILNKRTFSLLIVVHCKKYVDPISFVLMPQVNLSGVADFLNMTMDTQVYM